MSVRSGSARFKAVATYGSATSDASMSAVQRRLARLLPDLSIVASAQPLETIAAVDPPRTVDAEIIEDGPFVARDLGCEPRVAFAAFLDGTQRTRTIAYAGTIPIVLGEVAAIVRARVERRLVAWGELRRHDALYAPLVVLPSMVTDGLGETMTLEDTSPRRGSDEPVPSHPMAWMERAHQFVQHSRERIERLCAEDWIRQRSEPLLIDGGISGSEALARSPSAIGVVKTHRTLYVSGAALQTVFTLPVGQRSPVFRIRSSSRPAVLSWYLRLRDASGRDPVWGLVRLEVADREGGITRGADEVSGWLLSERTPIGLPGHRWDRMVYGVYGVEEYLRAL